MISPQPHPADPAPAPKCRCTVTVTQSGWLGSRAAAQAVGCYSISEMLEKLGRGELALVQPVTNARPTPRIAQSVRRLRPLRSLPKLVMTGLCAALILTPVLYVVELSLSDVAASPEAVVIPKTGDRVAGLEITDHFRIRPVHPVTGARNVPHNGVDVATQTGTPVYAVGKAGDRATVKCWWDEDGGGWVANQTAASYPGYVFQSLHLLENDCQSGTFKAGEVIARTGNSGLGTGEHYDFRVKIDGKYVPPEKRFLEAALTGQPLKQGARRWLW